MRECAASSRDNRRDSSRASKRVGNPSLHSVLEYSERTGAVRTLIRGGADFHRMLASEFATHILGQVVDAKRLMPEKIDLSRLPDVAKAVKPAMTDRTNTVCPYCCHRRGEVRVDGNGDWECCCPDCGAVPVDADDLAAFALDYQWLHRKLRSAHDIHSDGGAKQLTDGVWLLGRTKKMPVVLARDINRLWREPGLLDRVRVDNGMIRVIAPVNQIARGAPPDPGVQWMGLEEKFQLRGEGLTFAGDVEPVLSRRRNDPAVPVHGLFSADFRWVHLDCEGADPIRLTKAQAAVYRALWEAEGKALNAEQVMRRANLKSAKPIDVFKNHPEPKRAYVALVETNQKEGLYWMPCAAR